MRRALRLLRPLFRVPLPVSPERMFLPTDPIGVCYRFLPPDQLETADALQHHLATAHAELRAKDAVYAKLRRQLGWRSGWPGWRRRPRRCAPGRVGGPVRREPGGARDSLETLRSELGSCFLELEEREAEIHTLARRLGVKGPV
jgi:hypothetical protein